MWTNMHISPKPKVGCSLGCVSASVTHIKKKKNLAIKVKYCFISAASDARREGEKVLGETPQPPGHPDALTPGRADRVIPKCFRLRPDGCGKRDHMRRQTRPCRHIQFGIQLPRANNSCEPDALQHHSLKHMHTKGHRSHFLRALCSWGGWETFTLRTWCRVAD